MSAQLNPRDGFVVRSWNGQAIRMRAGRVCLTDLCKAGETGNGNPIRFANWFESEATQRFLQHRSAVTGREVFAISAAVDNAEKSALIVRESERGDAWGDEVVSLKLAGRLCTELEHEIYQWYAETRVSRTRDTQPNAALRNMREAAEIIQMLNIRLDERDHLHMKQVLLYQNALPAAVDVPISYAIEELGLCTKPLPLSNLKRIGMVLKRWFREERGSDPLKHDQYVDGAVRKVNTYPRDWIMGTLPVVAKTYPQLFQPETT
jgi:hypothetical protein